MANITELMTTQLQDYYSSTLGFVDLLRVFMDDTDFEDPFAWGANQRAWYETQMDALNIDFADITGMPDYAIRFWTEAVLGDLAAL